MTIQEISECDRISAVIEVYRATHHFTHSPCWMDEWAFGYVCAVRDLGVITPEQADFLFSVFRTEE